jgi:hypothetical protein
VHVQPYVLSPRKIGTSRAGLGGAFRLMSPTLRVDSLDVKMGFVTVSLLRDNGIYVILYVKIILLLNN